jgi:enterochelin esterase-like enzyme
VVVGASAGAIGVREGALPGRAWLARHLGDRVDGPVPEVAPGRVVNGTFVSRDRLGARVGWSVAYPPRGPRAGRGLPVAVVLHGKHGNHAKAFDHGYLALDKFLAAEVAAGGTPFALASVDGGNSYWHARDSGEDAGAMVRDELLPLLERLGLRTDRVGLMGWSMGGFGALSLAGSWGPSRVAAVAAESPALFARFADATPGAFDDAADLAAVTVFGRQDALAGIPVRIDCGTSDPFHDATRDYVAGFPERPAGTFTDGGHDVGYWRSRAPAQLRFLARAFA